jgi:shikimate kinase
MQDGNNMVMATGGGTPCFHDNMEWMNQNGTSVYLQTDPQILFQRLQGEAARRPLLKGKDDDELLAFIHTRLARREPYYRKATLVIAAGSLSSDEIASKIAGQLR